MTKKGYRDTSKSQSEALSGSLERFYRSALQKSTAFLDKIEEKTATHELVQNMGKAWGDSNKK
jgi:hypothetical protein